MSSASTEEKKEKKEKKKEKKDKKKKDKKDRARKRSRSRSADRRSRSRDRNRRRRDRSRDRDRDRDRGRDRDRERRERSGDMIKDWDKDKDKEKEKEKEEDKDEETEMLLAAPAPAKRTSSPLRIKPNTLFPTGTVGGRLHQVDPFSDGALADAEKMNKKMDFVAKAEARRRELSLLLQKARDRSKALGLPTEEWDIQQAKLTALSAQSLEAPKLVPAAFLSKFLGRKKATAAADEGEGGAAEPELSAEDAEEIKRMCDRISVQDAAASAAAVAAAAVYAIARAEGTQAGVIGLLRTASAARACRIAVGAGALLRPRPAAVAAPTGAAPHRKPLPSFVEEGSLVEISNMPVRKELNGQRGKVAEQRTDGRIIVKLEDIAGTKLMAFKRDNLVLIEGPDGRRADGMFIANAGYWANAQAGGDSDDDAPAKGAKNEPLDRVKMARMRSAMWNERWKAFVLQQKASNKQDPTLHDNEFLLRALKVLGEPKAPDAHIAARAKAVQRSDPARWSKYVLENGGGKCDPNLRTTEFLSAALRDLGEDGAAPVAVGLPAGLGTAPLLVPASPGSLGIPQTTLLFAADGKRTAATDRQPVLCRHHSDGRPCPLSSACRFAHGDEELQETVFSRPDRYGAGAGTGRVPAEERRDSLCLHIAAAGACPLQDRCVFCHSEPELQNTRLVTEHKRTESLSVLEAKYGKIGSGRQPPESRRESLCKHLNTGKTCPLQDRCIFNHTDKELNETRALKAELKRLEVEEVKAALQKQREQQLAAATAVQAAALAAYRPPAVPGGLPPPVLTAPGAAYPAMMFAATAAAPPQLPPQLMPPAQPQLPPPPQLLPPAPVVAGPSTSTET